MIMQKYLLVCLAFCLISLGSFAYEYNSPVNDAGNKKHTISKPVSAKKKKKSATKKTAIRSKGHSSKKTIKNTKPKKQLVKKTAPDDFTRNKGKFGWPMEEVSIKTGFGRYPIGDGQVMGNNPGITLEAAEGANVKSIYEGVVKDLFQIEGSWGVIVQHGSYYTVYSNLSTVNVSEDDKINSGTIIGKAASNSSGNAELEFLLMKKDKNLDPIAWIRKN